LPLSWRSAVHPRAAAHPLLIVAFSVGQADVLTGIGMLLTPPGPATLSGFRIGPDGGLTSVVNEARITLPLSAIGLAAE
jgi:hypothetical protein